MTNIIHQPHDHFFKRALGDLRVAKDFLHQHLPAIIKKQLDFSTLRLNKDSFIDDAFKNYEVDILYQATIQNKTGYIYLLLEHQSTIDPLLPFRLIKYLIKIIEQHLKQTDLKILPLVYPMVFYTGSQEYNGPKDIFDLFGNQTELAKNIWLKPFHLIDAKHISDDELKTHFWAGIMEFMFKQRALGNMMQAAEDFLKWLKQIELQDGFAYGADMLKYIINVDDSLHNPSFIELAKTHLSDQLRSETMTLREQWIQEGFDKGKLQGIGQGVEQGLEQGIEQGSLNQSKIIAKNLLEENMAIEKIAQFTGLSIEEIKKLSALHQTTE